MAWPSPSTARIWLTQKRRRELIKLAAQTSAPHALVQRARMILRLASGQWPATVARALGVTDRCVRKWRARWLLTREVQGLEDADRPGRPARISVAVKCELVEMACDREKGVAFRDVWTQQALADALLVRRGVAVSRSTVQRILHARGMRPHRVRQWLHSPDPAFRSKVRRVCGLYLKPPRGSVVLCIDEKPMQALFRRFPTRTVMIDGSLRREFEYVRHGTCSLLGALEVGTGRVFGQVVERRTADALVTFLDAIAKRYPHQQIYVVWDNLNIHG